MTVSVIGDAFVDISVPVDGVNRGETYHRNISMSLGGTANVAVEVSRLGEDAKFVGKVGNDVFGEYFKENLRNNGVKDLTFRDDNHPTGLCVSLVYKDGERSMVADRGANNYLTMTEVESCLGEIEMSEIIYFSGYSLKSTPDVILYLMKKCYGNSRLWLNPGAPNIIGSSLEGIIKDYVDTLILNLNEAKSLTKKEKIGDILSRLEEIVTLSVVTLGKEGCVIGDNGNVIQVPQNRVVEGIDTTGAGDAFSAGYIAGKLRGGDNIACAELGHKTAVIFLERKASRP